MRDMHETAQQLGELGLIEEDMIEVFDRLFRFCEGDEGCMPLEEFQRWTVLEYLVKRGNKWIIRVESPLKDLSKLSIEFCVMALTYKGLLSRVKRDNT